MNIAVYGAGYVGLVSSVCLANLGHKVICIDINEKRVAKLNEGECPIYEERLPELLKEQIALGRLSFSTKQTHVSKLATIQMIATDTPSNQDGSADLSQVFAVVSSILEHININSLIVIKSTVPVGTSNAIATYIAQQIKQHTTAKTIDVASNPEFLREGTAIIDFLQPERIIIGGNDRAISLLERLYQPLIKQGIPLLTMSCYSAELAKYAANAMLACKISFINYISQLAEKLNANIDDIRQAMALDHRIGVHFLQAGIGYGGACFPKDVRALVQIGKAVGIDSALLEAIDHVNNIQKTWIFTQINQHFKQNLSGLTIGIWGLAFKPGTDDIREASSLVAIHTLINAGVTIVAFDPVANIAAQRVLTNSLATHNSIIWCDSAHAVLDCQLDALVIATEWPLFKEFSLQSLQKKIHGAAVFDGRNCFDLTAVQQAKLAYYYSVGRPTMVCEQ